MNATAILAAIIVGAAASLAHCPAAPGQWARLPESAPHKVSVVSATRISCDGVVCQLLGVAEPADEARAALAKKFAEEYFRQFGGYFSIYNSSHPLSASDGTPIVWVIGHGNGGALNTELVRAGYLAPKLEAFPDYSFTMPGKQGEYVARWREQLRQAANDARDGKPPILPHPIGWKPH